MHKIGMGGYKDDFYFKGENFPELWIPYNMVMNFKLSRGSGSVKRFSIYDSLNEKLFDIKHYDENNDEVVIRFEMASSLIEIRTCKKLVELRQVNKIFDKFATAKPSVVSTAVIPVSSADEILSQIEKLGQLHKSGILIDEEFETKKAELLGRL